MATSVRAKINPELLSWARMSVGLDPEEAAQKLQISPARLEMWEQGRERPTINQLRRAATIYKRPIAVFYLPRVPMHFQPMHLTDFRRLPDTKVGRFSYGLALEMRRAWERRQVFLDLLEALGDQPQDFTLSSEVSADPEKLASIIRDALQISVDEQIRWHTVYETLNNWKRALENIGVVVFETYHTSRISLGEMRGFSISINPIPVVVVNSKDSPRGKAFTLLHELVHLLLRKGGVCDLEEYGTAQTEKEKVEVFCNHVAGAILLPADLLLSDELVTGRSPRSTWTDQDLVRLSQRYSVSREVVLRRLLIFERTTASFYRQKRGEFLDAYKKKQTEQEGFPPYHRLIMRSHGRKYLRLVLNAYYHEAITAGDVSEYLNVNLKHLAKIEAEVFR